MLFGSLEMINLRRTWSLEADDFTPWLSENLTLLSNILNMNLEFVGQHIEVGRYECDLLCRDTVGNSCVVIENQLEQFDHDHLGKALVYTAGLNARTVIWIAEDFTNEHRKTLDWLNENTHDCIQFFGVKLEVIQIDDSLCAPKFNIIVKPNNWMPTTIISDDYWDNFKCYLEGRRSSLDVLNWEGSTDYLGFYLGYGENNGQRRDYWIAAGKSNGFIAANFCIYKQRFPDILQWFTNNQQHVNQRFSEEFEEEPQWPDNHPFIVVGVRRLDNQIEQEEEFEWLRKRLEKLECLFKHGGRINFLSVGENQ